MAGRWMRVGLAMLFGMAGCNAIAGIREGTLAEEGTIVACTSLETCTAATPQCRTATACEAGYCVFANDLEGTLLPEQIQGDCTELVCDGKGKAKLVPAPTDAYDDENVCTLDSCNGMTPMHTIQETVPCYTGPAGTKGKGICVEGVQHCDGQGNPVGGCEGQIMPQAEICETAQQDEDCDGKVNEEGSNCVCGDGYLSVDIGETCDDGGTSDGDSCSPTCQEQKVLEIVGGLLHTCARLSGGRVKCWGNNEYGPLGLGDTQARGDEPNEMGGKLEPVELGTGKTATAIAAGSVHTCALLNDGSVKCWGGGILGLGDGEHRGDEPNEMGDYLAPVDLGTGKTATAIAAGDWHTCALLNDGTVKCWGDNQGGKLGLEDGETRGDDPNEMGDNLAAVNLGTNKTATAIALGGHHTCALLNDGAVKCWGAPEALGLGESESRGDQANEMGDSLPAVNLGTGKTAKAIAAGERHSCALLNDGTIKCWGSNKLGELGQGDTEDYYGDELSEMGDNLAPVNLGTNKIAMAISTGYNHTCALLSDGAVKCWGVNANGQLGQEDEIFRGYLPSDLGDNLAAIDIGSGKIATGIAACYWKTCARLGDGAVKCWGQNSWGQLGLSDINDRGDAPGEMGDALPIVKLFAALW